MLLRLDDVALLTSVPGALGETRFFLEGLFATSLPLGAGLRSGWVVRRRSGLRKPVLGRCRKGRRNLSDADGTSDE